MHPSLRSSSMRHGQSHRQDRNSPAVLLESGRVVAGGRFDLDPASNERALVDARCECYFGGELGEQPSYILPASPGRLRWRGDGLLVIWEVFRRLFCNPPWENLGDFFERAHRYVTAMRASSTRSWSLQMLVPLRPHRSYWDYAMTADAWCLLRPVTFDDFPDAMPTACAWLYWGTETWRFRAEFAQHGHILTRLPRPAMLAGMPRKPNTKPGARTRARSNKPMIPWGSVDKRFDAPRYMDDEEVAEHSFALLEALLSVASDDQILTALRKAFDGRSAYEITEYCLACDNSALSVPAAMLLERATKSLMMNSTVTLKPKADDKKVTRRKSTGKKSPAKKSTTKKAAKKPSAKSATKRAAKKPPPETKKSATKRAAKKTGGKKAASKGGAPRMTKLLLGDGKEANVGMVVCRPDARDKIGKIASIPTALGDYNVKVKWASGGRAVKVWAGDLVTNFRVPAKATSPKVSANDGGDGKKLSKTQRLDQAIVTEILDGRTTALTCDEVAKAMRTSASTALRALKRLEKAGSLKVEGAGRNRTYFSQVNVGKAAA